MLSKKSKLEADRWRYAQEGREVEALLKLQSLIKIQREELGDENDYVQEICVEFINEANEIATKLVGTGNADMAITVLKHALKETDPEIGTIKQPNLAARLRSTTLNNLGCAQNACGNIEEGLTVLRVACNQESAFDDAHKDPACFLNAAEMCYNLGRLDESKEYLELGVNVLNNRPEDERLLQLAKERLREITDLIRNPTPAGQVENFMLAAFQNKPHSAALISSSLRKIKNQLSKSKNAFDTSGPLLFDVSPMKRSIPRSPVSASSLSRASPIHMQQRRRKRQGSPALLPPVSPSPKRSPSPHLEGEEEDDDDEEQLQLKATTTTTTKLRTHFLMARKLEEEMNVRMSKTMNDYVLVKGWKDHIALKASELRNAKDKEKMIEKTLDALIARPTSQLVEQFNFPDTSNLPECDEISRVLLEEADPSWDGCFHAALPRNMILIAESAALKKNVKSALSSFCNLMFIVAYVQTVEIQSLTSLMKVAIESHSSIPEIRDRLVCYYDFLMQNVKEIMKQPETTFSLAVLVRDRMSVVRIDAEIRVRELETAMADADRILTAANTSSIKTLALISDVMNKLEVAKLRGVHLALGQTSSSFQVTMTRLSELAAKAHGMMVQSPSGIDHWGKILESYKRNYLAMPWSSLLSGLILTDDRKMENVLSGGIRGNWSECVLVVQGDMGMQLEIELVTKFVLPLVRRKGCSILHVDFSYVDCFGVGVSQVEKFIRSLHSRKNIILLSLKSSERERDEPVVAVTSSKSTGKQQNLSSEQRQSSFSKDKSSSESDILQEISAHFSVCIENLNVSVNSSSASGRGSTLTSSPKNSKYYRFERKSNRMEMNAHDKSIRVAGPEGLLSTLFTELWGYMKQLLNQPGSCQTVHSRLKKACNKAMNRHISRWNICFNPSNPFQSMRFMFVNRMRTFNSGPKHVGGVVFISGSPGSGKSAIMSMLMQGYNMAAALWLHIHTQFPAAPKLELSAVENILGNTEIARSQVRNIIQSHPSHFSMIGEEHFRLIESLSTRPFIAIGILTPPFATVDDVAWYFCRELLEDENVVPTREGSMELLKDIIRSIQTKGQRILLMIDGLDDDQSMQFASLFEGSEFHSAALIITVHKLKMSQSQRKELEDFGRIREEKIPELSRDERETMVKTWAPQMSSCLELVVTKKDGGSPQYLYQICHEIKEMRDYTPEGLEIAAATLPASSDELCFDVVLAKLEKLFGRKSVHYVFSAISGSRKGLTFSELRLLTGSCTIDLFSEINLGMLFQALIRIVGGPFCDTGILALKNEVFVKQSSKRYCLNMEKRQMLRLSHFEMYRLGVRASDRKKPGPLPKNTDIPIEVSLQPEGTRAIAVEMIKIGKKHHADHDHNDNKSNGPSVGWIDENHEDDEDDDDVIVKVAFPLCRLLENRTRVEVGSLVKTPNGRTGVVTQVSAVQCNGAIQRCCTVAFKPIEAKIPLKDATRRLFEEHWIFPDADLQIILPTLESGDLIEWEIAATTEVAPPSSPSSIHHCDDHDNHATNNTNPTATIIIQQGVVQCLDWDDFENDGSLIRVLPCCASHSFNRVSPFANIKIISTNASAYLPLSSVYSTFVPPFQGGEIVMCRPYIESREESAEEQRLMHHYAQIAWWDISSLQYVISVSSSDIAQVPDCAVPSEDTDPSASSSPSKHHHHSNNNNNNNDDDDDEMANIISMQIPIVFEGSHEIAFHIHVNPRDTLFMARREILHRFPNAAFRFIAPGGRTISISKEKRKYITMAFPVLPAKSRPRPTKRMNWEGFRKSADGTLVFALVVGPQGYVRLYKPEYAPPKRLFEIRAFTAYMKQAAARAPDTSQEVAERLVTLKSASRSDFVDYCIHDIKKIRGNMDELSFHIAAKSDANFKEICILIAALPGEEKKREMRRLDTLGRTCLHTAVLHKKGHAASALLQGIQQSVNISENFHRLTAAWLAKDLIPEGDYWEILKHDNLERREHRSLLAEAIREAAREGRGDRIQAVAARHYEALNDQDCMGRTALHEAAQQGHSECISALLKFRARPDIGDWREQTPLHYAVASRRFKAIQCLLQNSQGYQLSSMKDSRNRTPLHEWKFVRSGIREFSEDMVIEILAFESLINDESVRCSDVNGTTPLHIAVCKGHEKFISKLLGHPKINVNTATNDGWTPLGMAIRKGRFSIASLLMGAGSSVDSVGPNNKPAIILMVEAWKSGSEAVMLIHKILSKSREAEIQRGILFAAHFGHEDVIRYTLNLYNQNNDDRCVSPAFLAARKGHSGVVRFLINNSTMARVFSRQALAAASAMGKAELAGMLCKTLVVLNPEMLPTTHHWTFPAVSLPQT